MADLSVAGAWPDLPRARFHHPQHAPAGGRQRGTGHEPPHRAGRGAIGILVGIGVTVAVQSSTITTSILVPLVAAGVLTLRNAYPITVGANVGTTITALIASVAVLRPEGLTIALVHLLFNLSAMVVIFAVPVVRDVSHSPGRGAR
jgi:hypothetical protein